METEVGEIGHDYVANWLRSPEPGVDSPFDQDWDLIIGDTLEGDFPGHLDFYLHEEIPNPMRREYLLNALYVMAWTRFRTLDRGDVRTSLQPGLDAARASGRSELLRWAAAVEKQLASRWKPRYGFWCSWGWKRKLPLGPPRV